MVPDALAERWQEAYKAYGMASESVTRSGAACPDAAARMVSASRDVAVIWREIAAVDGLPWWVLAAVRAAAKAFESQSREWIARVGVEHESPAPRGKRARKQGGDGGRHSE